MKNPKSSKKSDIVSKLTLNPIFKPPKPAKVLMVFKSENVRKHALWYSCTFTPIITDEDLETIMSKLGFIGRTPVPDQEGCMWKEYAYARPGMSIGFPRLPYPRVDGAHLFTYAKFLKSVEAYVGMNNITDIFHVRAMPLHDFYDPKEIWKRIEDDDEDGVVFYRQGTLAHLTDSFSVMDYQNFKLGIDDECYNSKLIHNKGTSRTTCLCLPIKDIITRPQLISHINLEDDKD